ncbi:MAG: PspC domain-containing protein [Candidatus Falkowbacteria bacterium]
MAETVKKFYRSRDERIIFGVCGGLSEYFNVDVSIIRVIFILLALTGTIGFWLYLFLTIIAPLKPVAGKEEIISKNKNKQSRELFGLLLLCLGVVIILQKLLNFWFDWSLFMSVIIVFLGVYLLVKNNKK